MLEEGNRQAPIVRLLDFAEHELPSPDELADIPPRSVDRYRWTEVDFLVLEEPRERPSNHNMALVGTRPVGGGAIDLPSTMVDWAGLLRYLDQKDANLDND